MKYKRIKWDASRKDFALSSHGMRSLPIVIRNNYGRWGTISSIWLRFNAKKHSFLIKIHKRVFTMPFSIIPTPP